MLTEERESEIRVHIRHLTWPGDIIEELLVEIHRLRAWASESHVTDLEAEMERLRAELENLRAPLLPTQISRYHLREDNARLRAALEKIAYPPTQPGDFRYTGWQMQIAREVLEAKNGLA